MRWTLILVASAVLAGGCGGGSDLPPLPPGAPDPGVGEPDPRPEPPDVAGCGDSVLYDNPTDPGEVGPWPVGVRTATVDDGAGDPLTVEVWYPAERGSQVGVRRALYDLRSWLPPSEAEKIPDDDTAWQICDCHRDLPLDVARGPYPVALFIHGTAGFRTQSLQFMEHWASRGFVVVAADYPKLYLGDLLSDLSNFGMATLPQDTERLLEALSTPQGELAFLEGHMDLSRLGMAGHSAGGGGISGFGDEARVLIPMAAGGTSAGTALESTLVLAAIDDQVVPFESTLEGYEASPTPKRFLGIGNAGHLVFSDICSIRNAEGQDILGIAVEHGVMNAEFATVLFDGCGPEQIDPQEGWDITNHVTAAVLEETLQCRPAAAADLADVGSAFPLAEDYREGP
ncbi:MAG: chlorophyllase/cutinase-like alpha/beta fold protein [Myxococcota bacterium]